MNKPINQWPSIDLKARELYDIYLDSKKHSDAIGSKASISARVGGAMKAWDGYISGKILHLVPGMMIVQTWKGTDWQQGDESILTLVFQDVDGKGEISLT